MWDKRAEYLSTIDGGTVKMVLDQGFGDTKLVTLRLLGVYVPEKGATECKDFVEEWFNKNSSVNRWGYIVETVQLESDRFMAMVTDSAYNSCLNGEIADFIHNNDFK